MKDFNATIIFGNNIYAKSYAQIYAADDIEVLVSKEFSSRQDFPAVGEKGLLYVDASTGKTYQYINGEYKEFGSGTSAYTITSSSSQTVNGHLVPVITSAQIVGAYNAATTNSSPIIVKHTSTKINYYAQLVDNVNNTHALVLPYYDNTILTYIESNGTVIVDYKEYVTTKDLYNAGTTIIKAEHLPYEITGNFIQIDNSITNSDPATKITGYIGKDNDDVIRWIRNNTHIYCTQSYDSTNHILTIKQLSDTDISLYADGASASSDITTKDVFVKLPTFYYKVEEVYTDIWEITFDKFAHSGWNVWNTNKLIGKYEAVLKDINDTIVNSTAKRVYTEGDRIYSISGSKPEVYYSQSSFKQAARARGEGYSIVDYEAHKIMCLLFYAWYGNTDCQSICGKGTSSYPKICGQTNNLGMTDTTTVNGNTQSINFWGLENWWGDIGEWIDNLITAGSGKINVLNYDGTVNRAIQATSGGDKEIQQLTLGEYGDVTPKSYKTNANYNDQYCDYGNVAGDSGYVAHRSSGAAYPYGGVSYLSLNSNNNPAGVYPYVGARLLYTGNTIII